jgi:hypothetical protein
VPSYRTEDEEATPYPKRLTSSLAALSLKKKRRKIMSDNSEHATTTP